MLTVYFDDIRFSKKVIYAAKADVVAIGTREILDVKDRFDNTVAQFDMNCVIGWCINSSEDVEEQEGEE